MRRETPNQKGNKGSVHTPPKIHTPPTSANQTDPRHHCTPTGRPQSEEHAGPGQEFKPHAGQRTSIKKKGTKSQVRKVLTRSSRSWNPPKLLAGMKNGAATPEDSSAAPQKVKQRVTIRPSKQAVPLLGTYQRQCETGSHKKLTAALFLTAPKSDTSQVSH